MLKNVALLVTLLVPTLAMADDLPSAEKRKFCRLETKDTFEIAMARLEGMSKEEALSTFPGRWNEAAIHDAYAFKPNKYIDTSERRRIAAKFSWDNDQACLDIVKNQ